jgi:hypothetical protein
LSAEALIAHSQAFAQALSFLNKAIQPSNEELPRLLLLKFASKPPKVIRISCAA